MSSFGKYVRARRVAAGKSLRTVADGLGVTHVFLGEVERGDAAPLKQDHWAKLVSLVPGITLEDLEYHSKLSKPVQLKIADAPADYQNLALALQRRIENRDISPAEMRELRRVLGGNDK